MRRPLFVAAASMSLAAATLTACSGTDDTQSAPTTITTTVKATRSTSPSDSAPKPTLAADTADVAPEQAPVANNITVNPGQVGGICGKTADGVEIRADENTSCEFAAAIYEAARNATYGPPRHPDPTVQQTSETYFTLTSPVTGTEHSFFCALGNDGYGLSCFDQNNSSVGAGFSLEWNGGRSWFRILNIVT